MAHSIQGFVSNSNALSEVAHHRLESSSTVGDVFSLMCDYGWDRGFPARNKKDNKTVSVRRQVSRLKPIYTFCSAQIEAFCGGDAQKFKKLANQIVEHTFVIRIDIEDRAEAFEIFERTNARGKGFEVSDLLKNFLFSKEKEYTDESIADVWDEIVEGFGDNLLRALKYFWISRKGAVTSRDLYQKLRYYAGDIGVAKFIGELREFSKFYHAYHADDPDVTREWLLAQDFPANDMYVRRTSAALSGGQGDLFNELELIEHGCNLFSAPDLPAAAPMTIEPSPGDAIFSMTSSQALHILLMHKHLARGVRKRPGLPERQPTFEEVGDYFTRALAALKRGRKVSETVKARDRRERARRSL